MNRFQEVIDLETRLQEKLKDFGQDAFTEAFGEFFAAYPEVTSIRWHQFTPYFNDGDACIFGVGEPYLHVTPETIEKFTGEVPVVEEDAHYYDDEHPLSFSSYSFYKKETPAFWTAFSEIWNKISERIFLAAFGDHVEIIINRDGLIEVDEFSHD